MQRIVPVVLLVLMGTPLASQSPTLRLVFENGVQLEPDAGTSANVSVADLDADGDLDLVLAKGRHWPLTNRVLLNNGKGVFSASNLTSESDRTYSAVLIDVDGNGTVDAVVSNDRPDGKFVYLNDGTGRFTRGSGWGSPQWTTRNATVADLNGDGAPDIIAANRGGRSGICLNNGKGVFDDRPCVLIDADSTTTIAVGDFDRDGAIDLAVPHRDGGQSRVYFNDGKAGFERTLAFGPGQTHARAVSAGDLNGDGWLDLVVGDEQRGTRVYLNDGKGGLRAGVTLTGSAPPGVVLIADLNLDGRADVIVGYAGAPGTVFVGDGSGSVFVSVPFGDNAGVVYGLAVGDLNGDGHPDIAVARSDAPNVIYFRRPGPSR